MRTVTLLFMACVVLATLTFFNGAALAGDPTVDWIAQLGTSGGDVGFGVSADGLGNVYMTGRTQGDAFLAKHSAAGDLLWNEQVVTSSEDISVGVSTDNLGNVYMVGSQNSVSSYAVLRKYSAFGDLLWYRQLNTVGHDAAEGVTVDGLGNVYISGGTQGSLGGPNSGSWDAFLAKYSATGDLLWVEQLGTSESDASSGVSVDGLGNVYMTGSTRGSLGGPNAGGLDAFVSKYNDAGDLLWIEQLGTSGIEDSSRGVSVDSVGNVYITGSTNGSLGGPNAGSRDAFLAKYSAAGDPLWIEQAGTGEEDWATSLSADGRGNVYMAGWTNGSLGGPNAGENDTFVSKYNDAGDLQWIEQVGTSERDVNYGVSADGLGNVYMTGWTTGSLGGLNAGVSDAFIAKLRELVTTDFDADGDSDVDDLNLLLAEGPISPGVPVNPGQNDQFDLTGDGEIGRDDLDVWLGDAATVNGFGSSYKYGDANLDGTVDHQDFALWNDAKFTQSLLWNDGDFNADGAVGGLDFILWNNNKFTSLDGVSAVPEPATATLSLVGLLLLGLARRRVWNCVPQLNT